MGFLLDAAAEAGGVTLLLLHAIGSLARGRVDSLEMGRCLYQVAVRSFWVVAVTALFAGAIMVVQAGSYVRMVGAYGLLGWGAGFATFREVAPALIGLMFSGRVGANNTAELGAMVVTEQMDALRTMAISPVAYLVAPRIVAMVVGLFLLTVIGDGMALVGGAVTARLVLDVDFTTFLGSFTEYVEVKDLAAGLLKAACYGGVIGTLSCWFGLTVRGGAAAVGRAVNRSVVASAVGIFLVDSLLTRVVT